MKNIALTTYIVIVFLIAFFFFYGKTSAKEWQRVWISGQEEGRFSEHFIIFWDDVEKVNCYVFTVGGEHSSMQCIKKQ